MNQIMQEVDELLTMVVNAKENLQKLYRSVDNVAILILENPADPLTNLNEIHAKVSRIRSLLREIE